MYGWIGAVVLASLPALLCLAYWIQERTDIKVSKWVIDTTSVLWVAASLCTAGIWLNILVGLGIAYAALMMFILLPVVMFVLAIHFSIVAAIGEDTTSLDIFDYESWAVFGMAMAVSCLVTLCSLLIGNLVESDAWIPKTLQMLLCNVVFDGLTMVATFAILARSVGEKRKYPIPVAILIDLVVAALFACASLWLGLLGTEHALSIQQVLGVLIAKSTQDASRFSLGPYFWAMHTTFLPTLGYLTLILMFWIAKLIVLPVARVLKRGPEIEKPHNLMAGLFLFVAAVAVGFAGVLHMLKNDTPKRSPAPPAQIVEHGE